MADEANVRDGSTGSAAFESDMRRHRELMQQMADREHWESDTLWVRIARILGNAALYLAAFAGAAFIVWLLVFVILRS
jgi:hypothetical protein